MMQVALRTRRIWWIIPLVTVCAVSIAPTGGSFSPEKNPTFFVVSGEQTIMARWLGDGAVEIIGLIPGGGKVYEREQNVGDSKIAYP
jgi:hypothetical protein